MYESSGSQFFRTTTGIQSGPGAFDKSRFFMTFLTFLGIFFKKNKHWDSLYGRLNSHYKAWSYKKKKYKKITAYRKYLYKEPTVNRCLLILDLKPLRS